MLCQIWVGMEQGEGETGYRAAACDNMRVCQIRGAFLETGLIGKGWGGFLFGLNKNPPRLR